MRNFLLFALISGALLGSCTLDPECEWTDLYADFESYEFTTDLEQTNIVLLTPEFDPNIELFEPYIIRSDSAYDALTQFSRDEECPYCVYPEIDFDEYTLIGFSTEISCLATNYLKLTSTPEGWRYALKTVDETQCNQLLCDNFSFNWILLPKAADTTDITFETGLARYFCDC